MISPSLGSGLSAEAADNPDGMSSVQTLSTEQFIAVKRSDAKRIKQVDNLYLKEYLTTYKLPAELPLTCMYNICFTTEGSSDIKIFQSKSKEKKKIVMARGKDVNFSKASYLIKMSMNSFTRELRGSSRMSVLWNTQEKQFSL